MQPDETADGARQGAEYGPHRFPLAEEAFRPEIESAEIVADRVEIARSRRVPGGVGVRKVDYWEKPSNSLVGEPPVVVWIGMEFERKGRGDANRSTRREKPREILRHRERPIAMLEHAQTEDGAEPLSAQRGVNFFEGAGQIQNNIHPGAGLQIDPDVVALFRAAGEEASEVFVFP